MGSKLPPRQGSAQTNAPVTSNMSCTLCRTSTAFVGRLHCCFVEFRKAFDRVPRDVLWTVLGSIGVGGRFLSCLQAMYSKDCAAVKTAEGLSQPFRCHQGVQQGSPLSPVLFGNFVDALERLMQGNSGCDVPELDGHPVPLLLYADDLVLISHSAVGLQDLLHALHQFATYRRLQVSIKKTEVLVFQERRPALASLPTLHYNHKALKKVLHFKYLGLTLATQAGFREAIAQLCARARRAAFAVRHQCCRKGISSLHCILKLFNAKVLPILSYSCKVWFGTCRNDSTKRRWAQLNRCTGTSCMASWVCPGVHPLLRCMQSVGHTHWLRIGPVSGSLLESCTMHGR